MKITMPKSDPNAWIGDKILAQEDDLMAALAAKQLNDAAGQSDVPPPAPDPVTVDQAVERDEFAKLLALFANPDAGDAGTKVAVLNLDDFAEDTFTPTEHDNPDMENPS